MLKRRFIILILTVTSLNIWGQGADSVYTQVDQMPIFPGCDSSFNKATVEECTNNSLSYFIQQNLIIPFEFQKEDFKDIVYASFIVNEEGKITAPSILRSSKHKSPKIDSAAIASIRLLPRMFPGKQQEKTVKVRINVGVTFAFESTSLDELESPIFTIVEEMPIFPGCENEKSQKKRNDCTNLKFFEFITKRTNKVDLEENEEAESMYVSFIVNDKGNIEQAKILRSQYGNTRLESIAINIVQSLPRLNPGLQRGKPVNVQYNIPVRFRR